MDRGLNFVDQYVGARLRLVRNRGGLSQFDLARSLSIGVSHLNDMENGAVRLPTLTMWQLTQIFDIHVSYFFDGIEKLSKIEIE